MFLSLLGLTSSCAFSLLSPLDSLTQASTDASPSRDGPPTFPCIGLLVYCWVIISCSDQSVLTTHCSFPTSSSPRIFGVMHFPASNLVIPQFSLPQSDLYSVSCCVFPIPLPKPPFCSSFLLGPANFVRPERIEVFRTVTDCHRHLSTG